MNALVALIAGVVFGAGLLLSGMTNPANVLAFLEVTGHWQPALAYTMAAAVAVAFPAYAIVRRRRRALLGEAVAAPEQSLADAPLLLGSTIFGIGWGLSGVCPGPSVILLTTGSQPAFAFVGGLIVGAIAANVAGGRGHPSLARLGVRRVR